MSGFAADWLALREPADAAARDPELARRFAARLPRPACLADLGAGTGANARVLAPLIGGDQTWLLVEPDPTLRVAQREALLSWACRDGLAAREENDALIVAAGGSTWRFASVALDLARDWRALEAAGLDGVTCSAFLDLASTGWIERLAAWLASRRLPFYAALTVDGRRAWTPPAREDPVVAAAFGRHQARDKGLGPALGGGAAEDAAHRLAAHGLAVTTAASDWRLGRSERTLLEALVRDEVEAALEAAPEAAPAIVRWGARRLDDAAAAALGLTVGHRDLLALPA